MAIINTNSPNTTTVTADAIIEQVRTLRSQLPAVSALTSKERKALRVSAANSGAIAQASLNVIAVSQNVSAALGQPIDTVRMLQQEAILWEAAEGEVHNFLAGIAGANALRRRKLAQLGAKAYVIGTQLANDPENEVLVPHVAEIKRLKRIARRKKAAPATPGQPSPSTPAPSTPHVDSTQ
ncbi:MAG TPA: hypothetical protein VGJ81_11340 [Thermoanaerobaculia bacterium]|jgi:hypothetical protein